jgi:hypothetical protein
MVMGMVAIEAPTPIDPYMPMAIVHACGVGVGDAAGGAGSLEHNWRVLRRPATGHCPSFTLFLGRSASVQEATAGSGGDVEEYLMSFARECLLFVLLLIAVLLSAVFALAQLVSVPKRPRRQEAKPNSAQSTRSAKLSAVN